MLQIKESLYEILKSIHMLQKCEWNAFQMHKNLLNAIKELSSIFERIFITFTFRFLKGLIVDEVVDILI